MNNTWKQLQITSNPAVSEQIAELLQEQGALSVTFQDADDQPIYEPELNTTPLWQKTHVVALFSMDDDVNAIIQMIKSSIPAEQLIQCSVEDLNDKNWLQECQDQFQPMQFGDKLWVYPSWSTPPDNSAINIKLDPGLAFGTGTHATTALCLQWLSTLDLSNKTVIDYGCGSGILAIAAVMLGAKHVYAIDIDEQALQATLSNAAENNIDSNTITTLYPQQLAHDIQADVLVANILANPLIELMEPLSTLLLPQGLIGLSGILAEQTSDVINIYEKNFNLNPVKVKDGWSLLHGSKK